MVERIERDRAAAERRLLLLPVHARDAERAAGEQLRREVAQRGHDARLDEPDLAEEVALARTDLVGQRVAVAGRPRLQDVRDVDVGARQPDAGEQALEQLAGLADEGHALLVLVEARRLADEHQLRVGVARAEDGLRPGRVQRALGAAGRPPRRAREARGGASAASVTDRQSRSRSRTPHGPYRQHDERARETARAVPDRDRADGGALLGAGRRAAAQGGRGREPRPLATLDALGAGRAAVRRGEGRSAARLPRSVRPRRGLRLCALRRRRDARGWRLRSAPPGRRRRSRDRLLDPGRPGRRGAGHGSHGRADAGGVRGVRRRPDRDSGRAGERGERAHSGEARLHARRDVPQAAGGQAGRAEARRRGLHDARRRLGA